MMCRRALAARQCWRHDLGVCVLKVCVNILPSSSRSRFHRYISAVVVVVTTVGRLCCWLWLIGDGISTLFVHLGSAFYGRGWEEGVAILSFVAVVLSFYLRATAACVHLSLVARWTSFVSALVVRLFLGFLESCYAYFTLKLSPIRSNLGSASYFYACKLIIGPYTWQAVCKQLCLNGKCCAVVPLPPLRISSDGASATFQFSGDV